MKEQACPTFGGKVVGEDKLQGGVDEADVGHRVVLQQVQQLNKQTSQLTFNPLSALPLRHPMVSGKSLPVHQEIIIIVGS